MNKAIKLFPYLIMMGLLITGCAVPAHPADGSSGLIKPTYAFDRINHGQYIYTSSLGEVIWYEENGEGRILLNGSEFGAFSGGEAVFSFSDGRTMKAQINRDGTVEAVSVAPGVTVGTYDHEYIALAASVAADAHARAQKISVRNGVWMLILLILGVALFLFTPRVMSVLSRYTAVDCENRSVNLLLRAGGLVLAVIPVIVLIATGGNFR
jgi:hypothetical protein